MRKRFRVESQKFAGSFAEMCYFRPGKIVILRMHEGLSAHLIMILGGYDT